MKNITKTRHTPRNRKIKVDVLKDLPAKCPKCSAVLKRWVFQLEHTNMKNPEGRLCDTCNKKYVTAHVYYKYRKFFDCANWQDAEALIEEIEMVRAEKHERKMQKKEANDIQKQRLIESLENHIVKSNTPQVPEWKSVLQKSSVKALQSLAVAALIIHGENCNWYFITESGRKHNHAADNVYIIGPDCIMGRAVLGSMACDESTFKIAGDQYRLRYSQVLKQSAYENLVNLYGESSKKAEVKDGSNQHVYVYFKLNNKCITNSHHIETVTAKTINVKTGAPAAINVFYCADCNKYFINYEALRNYITRGIYPGLRYTLVDNESGGFNEMSDLMVYGYTVKEGMLSETERHNILSWIMDSGLISKADIIRDLQFKVNYNGKKVGNERAKEKWQDDIQFVSHYVKGNTRQIKAFFDRY